MRRLCPRRSRHQRVRRRASNDGKFPSKSYVYQQVGGSYYTVREVLQELEYNHKKIPLGNVNAAPLQRTVEAAEHSGPKDEAMVAQHKGKSEVDERLRVSFNNSQEMQVVDDVLISQKDAATSIEIVENKSSVSLGVEARSDPGNQQRETEAKELSLENTEKILNASESSVSDQSGNDKVIKANEHDREHNQKHEAEESTSTGLFGSLKSFAYGFRNFWKKL
ncbi:hypothetical protein HU200_039309 [Digitaria exilis]|uniref:AT3G52170-like helix-turn-helix domain-containing protein n=1 Tax=Digitaria exilis TaxID=1010633 RepID=A0A835BB64_9POAL|nr:hypothetical protein HU200_039309 [Digitaria exilis]